MEIFDKVRASQVEAHHCFTDGVHIFENVPSGELGPSFAPDHCYMVIVDYYPEKEGLAQYPKGARMQDFFKNEFGYMGPKEHLHHLIDAINELNEKLRKEKQ